MKKLLSLTLALVMLMSCLTGISFAADPIAKVVTGDKTVEVTTREELAAAISPRGTSVVTLLQDITADSVTDIPVCTIDLNGHTWKTTKGNVLAIQNEKTDDDADNFYTVIKNGTIHGATSAIRHEVGGLKISKCTLQGDGSSAIQILDLTSNGAYNDGNVIEDSTLICTVKIGALAYNKKNEDQSKLSYTIKNSSIINTVGGGYQPLSKASGNTPGTFVLDGDVNLYSYMTGGSDYASAGIAVTGGDIFKANATQTVKVLGQEYTGLTMWTTSDLGGGGTPTQTVNDDKENVNYTHPTSGQVTKTTLKKAAEMANTNGGGTITLLEDVIADDNGNINGSKCAVALTVGATVDLGGHTLSSTVYNAIGINAPGQTVVVKNGNIYQERDSFNIRLLAGYLEMDNVKAYTSSGANVAIYSNETEKDNVISNCTLVSETWFSVGYRPEASSGIVQKNVNTIVKNCTVVSSTDVVFAAYQEENKITVEGENHFYVSGKKHWVCAADAVPSVQMIFNAACQMADEKASVELTVAGEKKSYKNLKYFKVEPLAAGIDLSKPEAVYGNDLAAIQKALVETAYAFYNKGDNIIYSSDRLSYYARSISDQILSATYMTPEEIAPDNIYYSNCGRVLHNIFSETLDGFELAGGSRNVMSNAMLRAQSVESPIIVDKWSAFDVPEDQVDASRKAWVQKWYDNFDQLQPGDILVLMQEGGTYSSSLAGHILLYAGEQEGIEGGVVLQNGDGMIKDARNNMFNPEKAGVGTWNLYLPPNTVAGGETVLGQIRLLAIMRPLNDPYLLNAYVNGGVDAVLTDSAQARLESPGLEMTLTAGEIGSYASLEAGKSYTLNLEIVNNSNTAWDAEHALYMNGQKLKESGKVHLGDRENRAVVSNSADLTYVVEVPADAKPGDRIEITGSVNGIPTRSITFTVSAPKLQTDVKKAGTLEKPATAGAFVNQFCKEIFGIELGLPITMNGLKQELFKPVNNDYLAPKEQSKFYDMVLPDHFLGGHVILHHPSIAPLNAYADRVTKFHEDNYEVGDIFIGVKANWRRVQNPANKVYSTELTGYSDVAYVYLGKGNVAEATEKGFAVRPFKTVIDALNMQADRMSSTGGQNDTQWLVVLRPTLTMEPAVVEPEVPETPAVPETPETPAEPTAPSAPVEEKSAPVALIAGVVAAVAVLAVVILVVLKKKKK